MSGVMPAELERVSAPIACDPIDGEAASLIGVIGAHLPFAAGRTGISRTTGPRTVLT
jgi:hypothetical protein